MKKILLATLLFSAATFSHAETATEPATATAPVATPKPAVVAEKPKETAAAKAPEPAPVVSNAEQRRQQELLANAEQIDKVNRELLAHNQELELLNENLNLQNHVLQRDKSTDGIWKGAAAVIVGFLMGWFFASSRKKSSW